VTGEDAAERHRSGHAPWWFLCLTLGWTWACWVTAAVTAGHWLEPHAVVLFVLGGAGPLLASTLLVALGHADEPLASFLRRALDPRVMPPRWWLALTALAVLPAAAVSLGVRVIGDGTPVVAPVAFLVVGALAGAAEEPGWRGYAQEGLQRRMSVLAASLVVGVFWAAWHLPLFWLTGTYQEGLGVGTRGFWSFQVALLLGAALYGWIYNAAGRVTLAAVWFHAAANVASEAFGTDGGEHWSLALHLAIVATVLLTSRRWLLQPAECPGPDDRSTWQARPRPHSWSDHGNRGSDR
jgi:uncharacterized protein